MSSRKYGLILCSLAYIYEDEVNNGMLDKKIYLKKSLIYVQKALNILINVYKEPHHDLAGVYNQLAMLYEKLNEYGNALYYYREALKIFDAIEGENYLDKGTVYSNLARLFNNTPLKNNKRAIYYLKQALNIFEVNRLGEDHYYVKDTLEGYMKITKEEYDYKIV